MSSPPEPKQRQVLGRGRYLELVEEGGWEYVRRHASCGVVVVVATTDAREIVLVEQSRIPVHRRTIELPAGLVGDIHENEPLELAASRELEEETGFHAANWRVLREGPSSVGVTSEVITFFRATGLTRVGPGGGDETEAITVHVVPLADAPAFLAQKTADGLLIDPKVFAALFLVGAEQPPATVRAEPSAGVAASTLSTQPFRLVLDEPQGPLPFIPRTEADGQIVWEYQVSAAHFNPYAVLHGGVVMALMDSAMGHAVAARIHGEGRFNAAAQMNVNFLAAVRSGTLRARARVVKIGKRLAVVEAWAEADDGTPVATATATHSLLS